jgi:hypothetical protein
VILSARKCVRLLELPSDDGRNAGVEVVVWITSIKFCEKLKPVIVLTSCTTALAELALRKLLNWMMLLSSVKNPPALLTAA